MTSQRTDQDEWNGFVSAFDSEYLLPELLRRLEAVVLRDGEHAQETLAAAEVVVPNGRVVFLPRRVEDVDLESMLKNFFPSSLTTRPNKLECLSLETLSNQVLEYEGKARANPIGTHFRLFLLG